MLNPNDFKESYAKQDQKDSDRTEPVSGSYEVVNVKLQHQIVGQSATKKLKVIARVLKVVSSDESEKAAKMVHGTFGFDLWFDLTKKFNAERLAHLGIACGETENWDPTDDGVLVSTITGVPYLIKIMVSERETRSGKKFHNVELLETKHIGKEQRTKYMKTPDWKKIIGSPEDRLLKFRDWSTPADSPAASNVEKSKQKDPFSDPEDDFSF